MSKHTPGPWKRSTLQQHSIYDVRFISGPNAEDVAIVRQKLEMSQREALANAKLIAAAPNLLEAAKQAQHIFKIMRSQNDISKMLDVAIKKATR